MMTKSCCVDRGVETRPAFPLEPPAEPRVWMVSPPISVWLCPSVVTSLQGEGWELHLSGARKVPTSIYPFSLRVARSSSGYLAGKEKSGSLSGGPVFLGVQPSFGVLGSTPRNTCTRMHEPTPAPPPSPSQVPERKDSLVRAPNQIISYFAHSWPCWEFPSLLNFIWFSFSCKRLQKLLQKLC